MNPYIVAIIFLVTDCTADISDIHLSTPELIIKYGYPVETHTVLTEDGYFLTLHRIPYGRSNRTQPKQPIFVQHGILCSSADWVILGPEKALGYVLADEGYDVWLGNYRGNTFSKKHIRYRVQSKRFWDFSYHEMGIYDLPAVIDYILRETNEKSLKYIGHSMGSTMFFILMSEHPEYNQKISVMIGLAPVAYVSHAPSPVRYFMITNGTPVVMKILGSIGIYYILPQTTPGVLVLCKNKIIARFICENILLIMGGFGSTQLETSMVPVILGHTPAGVSNKVIMHFAQLMKSDRFCRYDYGKTKNKELYGSELPPLYKLSNVKVPVALYYSDHDALATRRLSSNSLAEVKQVKKCYGCGFTFETSFLVKIKNSGFDVVDFTIPIRSSPFPLEECILHLVNVVISPVAENDIHQALYKYSPHNI